MLGHGNPRKSGALALPAFLLALDRNDSAQFSPSSTLSNLHGRSDLQDTTVVPV